MSESSTDDTEHSETVLACPDCDRASVNHASKDLYRCEVCLETFEEPVERERRAEPRIRGDSLASALDEADPDDLMTDGGTATSGTERLMLGGLGADSRGGHEMPDCPRSARPDHVPAGDVEAALLFARSDVRLVASGGFSAAFWRNFWSILEWQWTLQLGRAAQNYEPTRQATLDETAANGGDQA